MSTKKERDEVVRLLEMSPQSRDSLGDPELYGALDDLVTDNKVDEYKDNDVTMYRLVKRDDESA